MIELPIVLDNLIEEELQDQIEHSMFYSNWRLMIDNTYDYHPKLMGSKYKKILSPFEYDISPGLVSNVFGHDHHPLLELTDKLVKNICDHIGFKVELVNRNIAALQGVQLVREQNKLCGFHVNQEQPHLVLLYYVNDADGETLISDKTISDIEYNDNNKMYIEDKYDFNIVSKVMPKRGRVLVFDGRTYHSASSPTTGCRCIISLDIFGKFEDGSYDFPPPIPKISNFTYQ